MSLKLNFFPNTLGCYGLIGLTKKKASRRKTRVLGLNFVAGALKMK